MILINSLLYLGLLLFLTETPGAPYPNTETGVPQGTPLVRVDAVVTSLDSTNAYVVIKARSALDRQYFTILSELGRTEEAVRHDTPYAVVRPGQQYRFVLEATGFFKISSPSEPELYDLLNLIEFRYGNLVIVGHGELPYVALNMYGYRIYP